MTGFDRIEQNLPEFMDRLASAQVPDYFDDMLQRSARTRQRPAWSSLERWIPMGVLARAELVPSLPWRPIGILVTIALLLVAGAFLLAGSPKPLPAPFGPAKNGAILYSTTDGDILSVDPSTGAARAIVSGPTLDKAPVLSRDGTQFLFIRNVSGTTNALVVANNDGSGSRTLLEGTYDLSELDSSAFDWSPDGRRIAFTALDDGFRRLTIVATDGSASKTFDLGMDVFDVSWRPASDELLFRGKKQGSGASTYGLYVIHSDGSGLRPILPVNMLEYGWRDPVLSPDGKLAAFARWGGPPEGINIVDIDSGTVRVLTFPGEEGSDEYQPRFSPDGTHLAFARFADGEYQLAVIPVEGGQPVAIGPRQPESSDPYFGFSPDGKFVLATFKADGTTWLLDLGAGSEQQVTWKGTEFQSWQRLAP
jgi:Tol biopolymer transport system component